MSNRKIAEAHAYLQRSNAAAPEGVAGATMVQLTSAVMGYEDFAFFAQQVPGMFVFLGARLPGISRADAAPNHSPRFVIDESALRLGVRTYAALALDFIANTPSE